MKKINKIFIVSGMTACFLIIFKMICYITDKTKLGVPCPVNKLFGINCASCGMTRAMIALSELNFPQALRYNLFVIPIFALVLCLFVIYFCKLIFKIKFNFFEKVPAWIWIAFLVLMLIYGIIRNIEVFEILLPTVR